MDLHSDHHPADHRTRHRPLVETMGEEVGEKNEKKHHAMLGQYTIFHTYDVYCIVFVVYIRQRHMVPEPKIL